MQWVFFNCPPLKIYYHNKYYIFLEMHIVSSYKLSYLVMLKYKILMSPKKKKKKKKKNVAILMLRTLKFKSVNYHQYLL